MLIIRYILWILMLISLSKLLSMKSMKLVDVTRTGVSLQLLHEVSQTFSRHYFLIIGLNFTNEHLSLSSSSLIIPQMTSRSKLKSIVFSTRSAWNVIPWSWGVVYVSVMFVCSTLGVGWGGVGGFGLRMPHSLAWTSAHIYISSGYRLHMYHLSVLRIIVGNTFISIQLLTRLINAVIIIALFWLLSQMVITRRSNCWRS